MATCVPISELKDMAAFSRKVAAAGEPVIVTKSGYENMVVLDPELFRRYRLEAPEERLKRLLDEAERDIRADNVSDARAGLEEIRARYGL